MNQNELKNRLEGMLFASGKSVSLELLGKILESDIQYIKVAIDDLKREYDGDMRGIEIIQMGNSVQLCSRKEYFPYIEKLFENIEHVNLSQSALETLAIIACNGKVTKADIEKIRGVNSDAVVNRLVDNEFIKEAGRIDLPGRPMIYQITEHFLRIFGLTDATEIAKLVKANSIEISNKEDEKIKDENI